MGILIGGVCPPTPGPEGPQVAVVVQIMGSFPLHRHTPGPRGTTLLLTPLGSMAAWATQPGSRKLLDTPYHLLQLWTKSLPGAAEKAYSFVRSVPG